jgi:hypothetical protein
MRPSPPAGLTLALFMSLASGCSTSQLVARGAAPLIDSGLASMNQETDLELARASMPANLKMIDALLLADPGNTNYRLQAAMGYYGYTLGFVETAEPGRAISLYRRAHGHARRALEDAGLPAATLDGDRAILDQALARLDARAVPALFWTASTWAKWIELQLDDPARIDELPRVEALMQRVLALDESYYFAGAHIFFGVYYGGRAPMFGGDFTRATRHFDRAAALNDHQLLLVEVYRARYLYRQMDDRAAFHDTLTRVLAAEPARSELNLANALAKQQAAAWLAQEKDLF